MIEDLYKDAILSGKLRIFSNCLNEVYCSAELPHRDSSIGGPLSNKRRCEVHKPSTWRQPSTKRTSSRMILWVHARSPTAVQLYPYARAPWHLLHAALATHTRTHIHTYMLMVWNVSDLLEINIKIRGVNYLRKNQYNTNTPMFT